MNTEKIVKINGKLVDMTNCLPMVMGDFRKLQKLGIDVTSIDGKDFEAQAQFCLVVLSRANKELTIDDIDMLTASEIGSIAKIIAESAEKQNRPFEGGSIT